MSIAQSFLPEFDHEMANTRRILERVNDDRFDWRPHPKSWTMGELATHISNLPSWATYTFTRDELDVTDPSMAPRRYANVAEVRAAFEANLAEGRAALAATTDEDMMREWTLLAHGQHVLSMPKIAVYRSMVMNHLIHHRGQMTVNLRINDIPVPGLYGPSADDRHV